MALRPKPRTSPNAPGVPPSPHQVQTNSPDLHAPGSTPPDGAPRSAPLLRRHAGIAVVLGLYLALAVTYSVVTPIFEASDELWHYPFVKHLADGGGLPVQTGDGIGPSGARHERFRAWKEDLLGR